jgi:hypothetical protein
MILAASVAVHAAEVPSVNTVGYVRLNVSTNFNLFSFNWEVIGGAQEVDVQDLLDTTVLAGGIDPALADNLWLWDPTAAGGAGAYVRMFLFDSSGAFPQWDGKWVYANLSGPATDMVQRGDAFWLKRYGPATELVITGQVPDSDSAYQVSFTEGFTLFGSGYTADADINSLDWSDSNGNIDPALSDNIWLWDPAAGGGAGAYVRMFMFESGGAFAQWDGKWIYNNLSGPATNVMSLGEGAWYINVDTEDVVWTETKPYTL